MSQKDSKVEETREPEQHESQQISKERLERFKRAFEAKWLKEKLAK